MTTELFKMTEETTIKDGVEEGNMDILKKLDGD